MEPFPDGTDTRRDDDFCGAKARDGDAQYSTVEFKSLTYPRLAYQVLVKTMASPSAEVTSAVFTASTGKGAEGYGSRHDQDDEPWQLKRSA